MERPAIVLYDWEVQVKANGRGTRAKWTIYENLKSLIDDEKAFAPDHVAELEKAIGNRKWKAVAENLFTATLYD